jgi:hypothetical protein
MHSWFISNAYFGLFFMHLLTYFQCIFWLIFNASFGARAAACTPLGALRRSVATCSCTGTRLLHRMCSFCACTSFVVCCFVRLSCFVGVCSAVCLFASGALERFLCWVHRMHEKLTHN